MRPMVDDPREIGPIGAPRFGGPESERPRDPRRGGADAEPPPTSRGHDRIELTTPQRAALALIKERVLVHTRQALDLADVRQPSLQFVQDPVGGVESFVDRLLSEQNLVAAARRREWSTERIERAVATATTSGIVETLELLEDVERLDAKTWRVVAVVLDELQRHLSKGMV